MLTENLLQTALTHVQLLASTYILNVHFLKYEFHQLKSYLHKIIWKGFVTPIFNFVTPLLKLLRENMLSGISWLLFGALLFSFITVTIYVAHNWKWLLLSPPSPRLFFFKIFSTPCPPLIVFSTLWE